MQFACNIIAVSYTHLDDYNTSRHGEVMEVLCEGFDEEQQLWYGRTYADSVEVDGHVYFEACLLYTSAGLADTEGLAEMASVFLLALTVLINFIMIRVHCSVRQ